MFFTLAGNRRRIEDAAAKARELGRREGFAIGRQEGIEIGRQEVRQQIRQKVMEWYAYAMAEFAAGRIPNPPPILGENGNGNQPG